MTKIDKLLERIKLNPKGTKRINLSESDITSVPKELKACSNLEMLDLSFTNITSIPEFVSWFPKLKKLSYLHCERIRTQPKGLEHLSALQELEVYIGRNQQIPDGLFQLSGLKSLTLNGRVKELDDRIAQLQNLEKLILFDTDLQTLPFSIGELKKLKHVSFCQSLYGDSKKAIPLDLQTIFSVLRHCPSLKEIELNRNGLTEIPESIRLLKELETFSARDNKISEFPVALYELSQLRSLDLGINQIKKVLPGIEKLKKIRILKLNSNWKNKIDLKFLFQVIDQLSELETLELWSCESVKELPESIGKLSHLKHLDIDNNLLTQLPEAIYSMKHLEKLRVSTNKIPLEQLERLKKELSDTRVIV